MTEPTPIRPRGRWRGAPGFVLGLAVGAIPLAVWLGALGVAFGRQRAPGPGPYMDLTTLLQGLMLAGALYVLLWIVAIALLAVERTRVIGQGAFAALAASPVIAVIGCGVIPNVMR